MVLAEEENSKHSHKIKQVGHKNSKAGLESTAMIFRNCRSRSGCTFLRRGSWFLSFVEAGGRESRARRAAPTITTIWIHHRWAGYGKNTSSDAHGPFSECV